MGRTAIYEPSKLTRQDVTISAVLVANYGPHQGAEKMIQTKYETFCRLNRLDPKRGHMLFASQMYRSGLAPGTIKEYLGMILRKLPHTEDTYITSCVVEKLHLDAKTTHAPDPPSIQELDSTLKDLEESNPEIWLMKTTGARPVDISRLHHDAIELHHNNKTMNVTWRWTKNNTKLSHRKQVTYPTAQIPKSLKLKLAKGSSTRPFEKFSAARANKLLRPHGLTSGSLRRAFVRRIEPWCKKTKKTVQEMTMHSNSRMLTGHYLFDNRVSLT